MQCSEKLRVLNLLLNPSLLLNSCVFNEGSSEIGVYLRRYSSKGSSRMRCARRTTLWVEHVVVDVTEVVNGSDRWTAFRSKIRVLENGDDGRSPRLWLRW